MKKDIIMKNKSILITICGVLLFTNINTTYAISHNNIPQKSASSSIAYSVHAIGSGAASLSAISVHKGKTAYVISGNVRIKTMQRRILRLPGYIHIELKSKEGKVLETIKVRMHRKYGVSKAAHFDAVLKSTPPVGSTIIITHKR
jgi:hypothetical protein